MAKKGKTWQRTAKQISENPAMAKAGGGMDMIGQGVP